jgi:ribonuclease G
MTEDILINITPQETRVALVVQGAVQELHIERTLTRGLAGNVYSGKVVRVLPGMQSAFIDIGLERAAFLHVADIWEARPHDGSGNGNSNAAPTPIEKILFDGQVLTVQVIKDPIGTKGARLSTQISIAGRMLVYLPQDKHIGISQKIEKEAEREALRARMQGPAAARGKRRLHRAHPGRGSVRRRPRRRHRLPAQDLERDPAGRAHPPATSLLYQDLSLAQRVLRDFVHDETAAILVDSRENYLMLVEFAQVYTPSVLSRLQHYTGERPLFDLYGVEEEILRALGRRVDLKSGGYLIVDQTEAMTTIDVNTGGFVGGRNFRRHHLQDQPRSRARDRAPAAPAQPGRHHHPRLHRHGEQRAPQRRAGGAQEDPVARPHQGVGERLLGAGPGRDDAQAHPRVAGPHPVRALPRLQRQGPGQDLRTICYEILRELLREAKQFNPREFRILASQEVVDLFLEEESQHLAMLGDFIGKKISLQVEKGYHQEQYDVILM